MIELKRHQYANLFHIFIVAPLIFLAVYPKYLEKISVTPQTFAAFMSGLIVVMVLFHSYRFVSGFDNLMNMFVKPVTQTVEVVPVPPEPASVPVMTEPEVKPETEPEVKPEEQGPVPMEGFRMF